MIHPPDDYHWEALNVEELNSLQRGDIIFVKLTNETTFFEFSHWWEDYGKYMEKEICVARKIYEYSSVTWFINITRIGRYNCDRDMMMIGEGDYET
jgi:hypothetical protein